MDPPSLVVLGSEHVCWFDVSLVGQFSCVNGLCSYVLGVDGSGVGSNYSCSRG